MPKATTSEEAAQARTAVAWRATPGAVCRLFVLTLAFAAYAWQV